MCFNSVRHCCQDSQKMALACSSSSQNLDPENPSTTWTLAGRVWAAKIKIETCGEVEAKQLLWVVWGRCIYVYTYIYIYIYTYIIFSNPLDLFWLERHEIWCSSWSIMYHQWVPWFWGHQSEIRSESTEVEGNRKFFCFFFQRVPRTSRRFAKVIPTLPIHGTSICLGTDWWWQMTTISTANREKFCLYLLRARTSQRMA